MSSARSAKESELLELVERAAESEVGPDTTSHDQDSTAVLAWSTCKYEASHR